MNSNIIFETLKKLSENQTQRKPMYIYQDEKTGQIIEKPLQDMAGSALIHKTVKQYNSAKEIHKFIFGS